MSMANSMAIQLIGNCPKPKHIQKLPRHDRQICTKNKLVIGENGFVERVSDFKFEIFDWKKSVRHTDSKTRTHSELSPIPSKTCPFLFRYKPNKTSRLIFAQTSNNPLFMTLI